MTDRRHQLVHALAQQVGRCGCLLDDGGDVLGIGIELRALPAPAVSFMRSDAERRSREFQPWKRRLYQLWSGIVTPVRTVA
jgi:hypothetical protein